VVVRLIPVGYMYIYMYICVNIPSLVEVGSVFILILFPPKLQINMEVTLPIREVPGSNLGPETGYPD
jgi:hypothetical protein